MAPPSQWDSESEKLFKGSYMDLTLGNYDLSVQGFKNYLVRYPDAPNAPEAYYYLGEAYGRQSKTAKSHGNLGLYYKKQGHLRGAIFHLKKALEAESDPDEKDKIQELLDEVQERWQKQRRGQSNP